MKDKKIEKFDEAYKQFLAGKDPLIHCQAIKTLLSESELGEWFTEFIKEKESVKNFFFMWEYASIKERDPEEKKGLKIIGIQSKKFYNQKDYRKLVELFFNITLRHLVDFIHLEEQKDFKKTTDYDLYEKGLIPSEIFLQFFLIETMTKGNDFNWSRGEEIAEQNLACFVVCFSDINAFFNEEG